MLGQHVMLQLKVVAERPHKIFADITKVTLYKNNEDKKLQMLPKKARKVSEYFYRLFCPLYYQKIYRLNTMK